MSTLSESAKKPKPSWVQVVKQYQTPSWRKAFWQVANSFGPFFALLPLMYLSLNVSYLLTIALGLLASGFMVRIFIIQHDAGHGSFFPSQRANNIIGSLCGVLSMTPYEFWRHSHAVHHAHNGELNHRGIGDVFMMTLKEYNEAKWTNRLLYRIYRNPFFMFFIGPPLMFVIRNRTPFAIFDARNRQGAISMIRTDLGILAVLVAAYFTIGLGTFAMIYLPIIMFTANFGVFLFYIQHQFEDGYWSTRPDWDYFDAAMEGSTYLKLPKVLQWFTGNIGLHHIHHLSPRIPNYELQRCHDENPELQNCVTITLMDALKVVAARYSLWDNDNQKMITFGEAHRRERDARRALRLQKKAVHL